MNTDKKYNRVLYVCNQISIGNCQPPEEIEIFYSTFSELLFFVDKREHLFRNVYPNIVEIFRMEYLR